MRMRGFLLSMGFGVFCAAACGVHAENAGDLNGDLRVDQEDLAMLAAHWLADYHPPTELPLLDVVGPGVTPEAVEVLAEQLGLDYRQIVIADGAASYFDKTRFQWVPTRPVTNQATIYRLRQGTEMDYGDATLLFRSFDLDAIRDLKPIPEDAAEERTSAALRKVKLLPESAEPTFHHSVFSMVDRKDQTILQAALDTEVDYEITVNSVPLVGPGARLSVTYDTEGMVTQMLCATRRVQPGGRVVRIAPPLEAIRRYIDPEAADSLAFDVRLVYYAPPLSVSGLKFLLPYYDVGGTFHGPQGQAAERLRRLIPATLEPELAPFVELSVSVEGNWVTADATAQGAPPYTFQWISSSVPSTPFPINVPTVAYRALPRGTTLETITVVFTDGNGTLLTASETVQVALAGTGYPPTGGINYGTERGVSDLGAANQIGFISAFDSAGVAAEFNYDAVTAWEKDFKFAAGAQELVDTADIVFYEGHGNGGGFTFETQEDDGYLFYNDARLAWGNDDLEFLCLLSCSVLQDSFGGKSWASRWGWTFDGLHLICGFETSAYDTPGFAATFANSMLNSPALPIRMAWFQAHDATQPGGVVAKVIGVVGPDGCYSGWDDYFWGKGPISPDIPGNDVELLWYVTHH